MAVGDNYLADDYADLGTDSGSALDSILATVNNLGSAAILSFGPQNSGLAVNPGGQTPVVSPYYRGSLGSGSGAGNLLLIGVVVLVGIFAWKRL